MEKIVPNKNHATLLRVDLGHSFKGHRGVISYNNWNEQKDINIQITNSYYGRHASQKVYIGCPVVFGEYYFDSPYRKGLSKKILDILDNLSLPKSQSLSFVNFGEDEFFHSMTSIIIYPQYNWLHISHVTVSKDVYILSHMQSIRILQSLNKKYMQWKDCIMSLNLDKVDEVKGLFTNNSDFYSHVASEISIYKNAYRKPDMNGLVFDLSMFC